MCTLLEENKGVIFFEVVEEIIELGGIPISNNFSLIPLDYLYSKLCKSKEKLDGEFDNLKDFSKENIKIWIITYVYFNNDNTTIISQGREKFSHIEKDILT